MNDHSLVTQLLCAEPSKVVLVGKPMFRLKASIAKLLASESYTASAPQITEYDSINQLLAAADGASESGESQSGESQSGESQKSALGLHLPSDADDPEQVLGVACRASPGLVLVEHTSARPELNLFGDEHFFAYGFRRIGQTTEVSGLQQQWYAYSLRDYKQAPDWLNARFWAHPERFDLQD